MDLTRIYLAVQDSSPNMFQFTFKKGADRKCLIAFAIRIKFNSKIHSKKSYFNGSP